MKKQGTATMGGLAILFSAFIGWLVAHLRGGIALSDQAMIMWAGVAILATMGFLDDFLKVRKSHNRGIFWKKKGWITFGLVLIVMYWLSAGTGVSETLSFTRFDLPGWELNQAVWIVWTAIMVWSTTNAVNVTDGLDGLAAGSALFGFLAFTVIAYWARPCSFLCGNGRRMWWFPVVECCSSKNFYGRCWCTWHWCCTWSSCRCH
jgi:phospho-N-acetylmuramoyl-pentapeptide-transferase